MERRHFIRYLSAGMISLSIPMLSLADTTPSKKTVQGKIIVIGGGLSGATVAKYLRLWGGGGVDVTLIDSNTNYHTCIHSSLILTGQRQMEQLTFDYRMLSQQYGIKFLHDTVDSIDTSDKKVILKQGQVLSYEQLIIAPGIDFDWPEGMTENDPYVLHAWKGGQQVMQLKQQMESMVAGDTFILSIPKMPYRCPPGPYERACLIADYLKQHKKTCRIIVLDANADITAGKRTFLHAFENLYADTLLYLPNTALHSVDYQAKKVETSLGALRGNVFNIIPEQRAGSIIAAAGLNNVDQRWAGVDMLTYESTAAKDVYIIGDAAATTQPKAGHIANAEAKVCAAAVISRLQGESPNPSPRTTSACYTVVSQQLASWLTILYQYDPQTRTMKMVAPSPGEGSEMTEGNFSQMTQWYDNLMRDTFA